MYCSVANGLALSTLCFLLVVWQAIFIHKRRRLERTAREREIRQLYAGLARSPSCTIDDRGQGLRIATSVIHGNGVFAAKRFSPGDLIEICPLVWIPDDGQIALTRFTFRKDRRSDGNVLVLGYGSLYNHSFSPNAVFSFPKNAVEGVMKINALRRIDIDDEILINYGPRYWKSVSEVDAVLSRPTSAPESTESTAADVSVGRGRPEDTNDSNRSSEEA